MIALLLAFCLQGDDPPPVTSEPALHALPPENDPDRRFTRIPGGGYVHRESLPDGSEVRRVVLPAVVSVREGPIELFAAAEGGKGYESVFGLACDVSALDIALTLCGLTKGPTPDAAGPAAPEGDRALLFVQWELEDGATRTVAGHDLVLDLRTGRAMPRVGWTYVGRVAELVDSFTGRPTGRVLLEAARSRSLVTTWRDDGSGLLQNPLAPEAFDDTRYAAFGPRLPAAGSAVRLIFRAPTAAERDELRRAEER